MDDLVKALGADSGVLWIWGVARLRWWGRRLNQPMDSDPAAGNVGNNTADPGEIIDSKAVVLLSEALDEFLPASSRSELK